MSPLRQLICAVATAGAVLARNDLAYNAGENFRPDNVTDLGSAYHWIGSYYNGSTQVEVTPETGHYRDDELCDGLRNNTVTMHWDSILAVSERGDYNRGENRVNMWLLLIPNGYNMSAAPWELQEAPFWWPMRSTIPTKKGYTANPVDDLFNFTLSKTDDAYSLRGVMENKHGDAASHGKVQMDTCDANSNGTWSVTLWQEPKGTYKPTEDWDGYAPPSVMGSFDASNARLVIEGKYNGAPYQRGNSREFGPTVEGSIRFLFAGHIDASRSDVLDPNASSPRWLRTVGFGNNTDNIGNSAASLRLSPLLALAATALLL